MLLIKNKESKKSLTGDVLISSGIIAYLGVFTKEYWEDCIKSWVEKLHHHQVVITPNFKLENVLGDQVKIAKWRVQRLPADDISTENAIILENSDKWPLFIDPQMQANIWIKKMEEASNLKVVKPTTDGKEMGRILENAVQYGWPLLFEDADEIIDP